MERCALSFGTGNLNQAAVIFDDAIHRGEPYAGLPAGFAGTKKRFEDPFLYFRGHAFTLIGYFYFYKFTGFDIVCMRKGWIDAQGTTARPAVPLNLRRPSMMTR